MMRQGTVGERRLLILNWKCSVKIRGTPYAFLNSIQQWLSNVPAFSKFQQTQNKLFTLHRHNGELTNENENYSIPSLQLISGFLVNQKFCSSFIGSTSAKCKRDCQETDQAVCRDSRCDGFLTLT
jgi:hypothetical protein